jgi:P27 family predicted phage terminase small subunit
MYADAYQRWVESSELLNETGQLIRGRDGLPVASPAVKVQADAWARVVRSLDALGMTPAARPKVVAQAKVEPTDWWKEVVGVD